MAKSRKKPDSKRSLGIDRHTRPRIAFHLDPALDAALRRLAAANHRSITGEIALALEAHAKAAGLWPPPQP